MWTTSPIGRQMPSSRESMMFARVGAAATMICVTGTIGGAREAKTNERGFSSIVREPTIDGTEPEVHGRRRAPPGVSTSVDLSAPIANGTGAREDPDDNVANGRGTTSSVRPTDGDAYGTQLNGFSTRTDLVAATVNPISHASNPMLTALSAVSPIRDARSPAGSCAVPLFVLRHASANPRTGAAAAADHCRSTLPY